MTYLVPYDSMEKMISLSNFLAQFQLHDSGVEDAEYRPAESLFRLRIDLCNYDQSSYRQGDKEILAGWILFHGVTYFSAKPSLTTIQWSDSLNGEILVAELDGPSGESSGQGMKLVISLMDYISHTRGTLVIELRATLVEWVVDS